MKHNILITGGLGFIGSHATRFFVNKYSNYKIFNIDIISYAANSKNLSDLNNNNNYNFIKGDIRDFNLVKEIFKKNKINKVIHFAAETHVDRSIIDPLSFAQTNVIGTLNLLQAAKETWADNLSDKLFYHISTDEVYGSLTQNGFFTENSKYDPHSPYAASKASSDHFVRAFGDTFSLPVVVSHCSNNYGPCQYPEKLIPLFISNIINHKPLPVYGKGDNIRDWLYVDDHINAIDIIFHNGKLNETYNVGGFNEWKNIDLIKLLIKVTDHLLNRKEGASEKLIRFVKDRDGHDYRYAIDSSKLKNQLGWKPSVQLNDGLKKTVSWYLENRNWFKK